VSKLTARRPSPVIKRATAKRTTTNTAAILKALTFEANHHGLDQISASAVATRAGLTTGAIYSRYEHTDEMLVALWQKVIASELADHLYETVSYITSGQTTELNSKTAAHIDSPSQILRLGVEFLIVARRNDTVGEIVIPQVTNWLQEFGLRKASTPLLCAGVALGASTAIGAVLRSFVTTTNPGLSILLPNFRNAYLSATPSSGPPPEVHPNEIHSNTGNTVRDVLIDATAEVMSRTGFAGATISRIARRSDLTSGSLYNIYKDKEELMNDAVRELLRTSQSVNVAAKADAARHHRSDFGLTDSFQFGLIPDRQSWIKFRNECIVAARHHRTTRNEIRKVFSEGRDRTQASLPNIRPAIIDALSTGEQAIGLGYTTLNTYTDQFARCDFYAIMTRIAKQANLT